MSESFVQLPPDSTGKKPRTLQQTVGPNSVEVQAVALADPTDVASVARVATVTPAIDAAALVVRPIPFGIEATAAKQDAQTAMLFALAGKDFATQATLAAILAKIIAAPGTETTLTAILAKLITAPATEVTLAAILAEAQNDKALQETIWTDGTSFYIRRLVFDESAQTYIVSYTTPTGGATTLPAGAYPVATGADREIVSSIYAATAGGTGYVTGDTIGKREVWDVATAAPTILATFWENLTTGVTLTGTPSNIAYSGATPGAATAANQAAILATTGATTEAAPASDTASSGLNGRLQRIAQRITSLLALLPVSLGIKTASASLSVAPASDAVFTTAIAGVTYTDRSGTITVGGTAQQLAAANASRKGYFVQNNSAGDLWINSVATAVLSQPSLKIVAGALYESPANGVPVTAISIIGATTGQTFSAREF